jgi:uncharacterized protein YndB with AHSA1/START domain
MLQDVRLVTVSIAVPWQVVYEFARQPALLPQWASGLAAGIAEEGGRWWAESPMGRVQVEMTPDNPYGVLDHDVTLPDGTVFHNPLRAVANGDGCELSFTVFRADGVDSNQFEKDCAHVQGDLQALKRLMESRAQR